MSIFATIRGLGQTTQDYLNLISQYESGNQNIVNYKYASNPQKYSAQGYYQITNTNWTNIAPLLGIDLTQYPTAMSAPQDVQAQVATYLLTQTPGGISNWGVNPQLMAALSAQGLQTSGTVTPTNGSSGAPAPSYSSGSAPLFDLSGSAASTPTTTLMDTLTTDASTVGLDLTNPVTDVMLAAAAALALVLVAREVF